MAVTNIFYFPRPASGGGIERNFALWYAHGRQAHHVKLASKTRPAFCDDNDFISSRFTALAAFLRRQKPADETRLFVFRGMMKPLLLKWFGRAMGASVKIFYRASNDPLHWWHERSPKRALSELLKFAVLRFYDGIVFNSEELQKRCRAYGGAPHLLRNAVSAQSDIHFRSVDEKKFLYVGRAARQKNLPALVEAFALLGPAYRLDLMGVAANGLRLPENVSAMNWQESVPFADYHYFIMPSLYEGAPNALLEAVNAGLIAVITPFSSGGCEILKNYNAPGEIAEGFTAANIAAAVKAAAQADVDCHASTPKPYQLASFDRELAALLS
jgi:glycosyltransferase involved in cell wall biosynthesis